MLSLIPADIFDINSSFQICGIDISTKDGTDGPQCSAEASKHHCGLFKRPGCVNQEVIHITIALFYDMFASVGDCFLSPSTFCCHVDVQWN